MKHLAILLLTCCLFQIASCTNSNEPEEITAFRNLTGNWELYNFQDGELVHQDYMIGPDLTIDANTPSEVFITGIISVGTIKDVLHRADTATFKIPVSTVGFIKHTFIIVDKNKFHWYQDVFKLKPDKDSLLQRIFSEGHRVQ